MEGRAATDRLWRAADGRVRLGWRLVLFGVTTSALVTALLFILPATSLSGSVALLIGAVVGGMLALALDGRGPGALGFYLSGESVTESLRGLALGVVVASVVVLGIALFGGLHWIREGGTMIGWLQGAAGALLLLALPAAAEEALLRGYPLQALADAWGPWWGLGLTAGVFGALHLRNPGITAVGAANVIVAGLFLGVLYLRAGSLWWASGAHLGWNFTHGYLADVPVSGLEILNAPLYEGVLGGPRWLGGGAFGPEGSLVATVVVGAAAVLCWRSRRMRPGVAALAARPLALAVRGGA